MAESSEDRTADVFKKEFRSGVIKAIVAGGVAIALSIGLATWALIQNMPGSIGIVPRGAVVAFEMAACPAGWSGFNKAWGRVVIGAVSNDELGQIPGDFRQDARGADLVEREFGTPGGAQQHLLVANELPAHQHFIAAGVGEDGRDNTLTSANTIKYTDGAAVGHDPWYILRGTATAANLGLSSSVGGSQPHDIIPPYVALNYCRKE